MTPVFLAEDSLITPFGLGSDLAFQKIISGETAVKRHQNTELSQNEFFASLIEEKDDWFSDLNVDESYTRLEKLTILCIQNLIEKNQIEISDQTSIVLSSTKGNISLLENPRMPFPNERALLTSLTKKIEHYFKLKNKIQIVSNACISGSLAIEFGKRILQNEKINEAIIVGADEVSRFVLAGFESFQAVSNSVCRPFDRERNGINLGEAIAAINLTKTPTENSVEVLGCGTYNDANHISGPSRTAEGLYRSIQKAIENSRIEIDFISAHGTATLYNDEMESVALHRSGLSKVPTNSLKGYFGHTLGASGLLESILNIHSLKNNRMIPSYGFENQGTTFPVNIIQKAEEKALKSFMKTASGFGGCNIATVFQSI